MGVMDGVLNEARSNFGISDGSAFSLISGLFTYIDDQKGGLKGVLDRFRQVGMANVVSSWLSGTLQPISAEDLESALESNTISMIASASNLSVPIASCVLAFMFPKIVWQLAREGVVPTHLPSEVMSYISKPAACGATEVACSDVPKPSAVWPILGLVLLALVGLWIWIWNRKQATRMLPSVPTKQLLFANRRPDAALACLRLRRDENGPNTRA